MEETKSVQGEVKKIETETETKTEVWKVDRDGISVKRAKDSFRKSWLHLSNDRSIERTNERTNQGQT